MNLYLTAEQRLQVVTEARAWVEARTPYVPHAKLKGLGCDCATFLLCVFRGLGLIPLDVDPGYYSIEAHMHRAETDEQKKQQTQYVDLILTYADEIFSEAEIEPGDMVLWKTGYAYAHGGIVIAWPLVVHSTLPHGVVYCDANIDIRPKGRPRRFFRRNFSKEFTATDAKVATE